MKRKFFSALLCAMISFCLIVSSAACVPEENKEPDDGGPPIVTPQPDDDKDNETPGEEPDGKGDPSGEGPGVRRTFRLSVCFQYNRRPRAFQYRAANSGAPAEKFL